MILNKTIRSFIKLSVIGYFSFICLGILVSAKPQPVYAAQDCQYRERVPNDGDIANVLGQAYVDGNPDGPTADAAQNMIRRKDRGETWLFISCGNKPEDKYYLQTSLSDEVVGAGEAVDVFFINEVYGGAPMLTQDSLHDSSFAFIVSGLWIVNTDKPGVMKNSSCDSSLSQEQRRSKTCRRTLSNLSEAVPWLAINTDPQNPDGTQAGGVPDPSDIQADGPKICEENFRFPGSFLVCIVLQMIDKSVNKMVDAIADMLSVNRSEINDDGLKAAWSYFRNIASVLLVVIGLVMIIGQAVSKE